MANIFSKLFSNKTVKRKYEGASRGKRMSRWLTQSTSANTEVSAGLVTLRDRARDLRRNNPYAAKGVQVISSNVIGHGIETQFRGDGVSNKFEQSWRAWSESTEIDFDGRNTIYGLQRLIMEAVVESGEVLVRKRFIAGSKIPLKYQILESDFLDVSRTQQSPDNGNNIIQGIEFDNQGRRVAYWLYEAHPGGYDSLLWSSSLKSNRIPADEVLHIYRQDRPGQARGVTWFSPVIVRLKDFDDYEDAQLLRQKIAACFTAFVHDLNGDVTDVDEECGDLGDKIEPAMIEMLPPGKSITFANPPGVQNYKEYTSGVLRGIAAGLGVTYESLTADLSNVNFSSGRMGWLEFHRNIQTWREHIVYAHFLDPIVQDFKNIMEVLGVSSEGITHVHVPPKREMIDPTKEVPATIKAIRAGLTTLSDEILALVKDPREHLKNYKNDVDLVDKLGLSLTTDARVDEDPANAAITKDDEGAQ
jgi:lambda family phage portal protein